MNPESNKIEPLILRWKIVLSYFPLAARAKKFLVVLGQSSQKSSILMLPWVVCSVRDILCSRKTLIISIFNTHCHFLIKLEKLFEINAESQVCLSFFCIFFRDKSSLFLRGDLFCDLREHE